MKTSQPPFIAAWLLDRLGADPQMEAIAGDLLEQYRLGRSRFWYWREVITAIIAGMWSGFRDHKLLVTRALVIGWILIYAGMAIWVGSDERLLFPILPHPESGPWVLAPLFYGPWCVLTGWIVAQCAQECRIPAVLGFAVSFLSFFLSFTVLGNMQWSMAFLRLIWMTPLSDDFAHFAAILIPLSFQTMLTTLILLGGGLLTGSPKRSMPGSRPLESERLSIP